MIEPKIKNKTLIGGKIEFLITKITNKKDEKSELKKLEKIIEDIKNFLTQINSFYPDYEFKWKI